MNEKQQDTALDLLESASNLLHGPLMFLMGTPGHDIHKEAVDGWMEKYEALTDEVEDGGMNEKTLRQQFEDAKWEGRNPLVIVTGQLMGERQGGSSFQDLDTAGMFYWNLLLDGRNPTIAIELPPPVDRSNVCTTDGRPAEEVRAEQQNDPEGMHKSYLVLCADERAKGFVRPLRDEYRHEKCGTVTTMGNALAQTYARDPGFYGRTFCVHCGGHFPVGEDGEFVWLDGSKVGT